MTVKKYIALDGRHITILVDDDCEWLAPEYSFNLSTLEFVTIWGQDGKVLDYLDRLVEGISRDDRREIQHVNGNVYDCRLQNLAIYNPDNN